MLFVGAGIAGAVLVSALGFIAVAAVRATELQWDQAGKPLVDRVPWMARPLAAAFARRLRQVQLEHEASQAALQALIAALDALPGGLILLDAGQQMEWCNRAASVLLGLDPLRDKRQRITNLVRHPDFVQSLSDPPGTPVLLPGPTGSGRLSILRCPWEGGRQLLYVQDESLREQAETMRREFVANVSHEIRTPLTVLSGYVETLQELDPDPEQRRAFLNRMAHQAARMKSLVADLLILARLEGSPRPSSEHWFALDDILDSVRVEAESVSQGAHHLTWPNAVHLEFAGVASEIHSAIGNLVNNAIRYTPAGGAIRVTAEIDPTGFIDITVEDTGIGIPREHLPRLAQRFYRVDASRSRETGGTGLGLAIVKHAVQRHGGELSISSEPGRGSRFSLRLPAVRCRQAPADR